MPVAKLKEFLEENKIKYVCISHSPAYTAQEIAESAHVSGKSMAKVVMINSGNKLAMVITPASKNIDFVKLKKSLKADEIELATESQFKNRFPDCELGAMPPFGNLFGIDVYVAKELAQYDHISFNSGSHSEIMQLAYKDFTDLVHPKTVEC